MAKNSSMFSAIQKVWLLLSRQERWKWGGITSVALVSSVFEVASASVLVAFANVITDPSKATVYLSYLGMEEFDYPGQPIFYLAIAFGLTFLLKNIVATGEVFFRNFSVRRMNYRFKEKLLHKYAMMDYEQYLNRNSSKGIAVLNHDVEEMFSQNVLAIASILSEALVSLSLLAMVIFLDPDLAVFIFGLAFCLLLSAHFFLFPIFYRWGEKLQESIAHATKQLVQFFHGFKEVVLFHKRNEFVQRYKKHSKVEAITRAMFSATNSLPRIFIEVLFVGLFVVAIAYMSIQNDDPQQMISVMGGYLYLGFRVMPGLNRLIGHINEVKWSIPCVTRVYEEFLMTRGKENIQDDSTFKFSKDITLKNVSFQYSSAEKEALTQINLVIKKGEYLGIVGATGSGKSTIVDLILGLLNPTQGAVYIDGKYSPSTLQWHRKIGYVPQSIYLIDDTVESNIAFGETSENIDSQKLWQSIKAAQLEQFVQNLPDKEKTFVGERGVRLSGGERQRIAIARALYREPEVIIFDEATSALDTATESKLMETINAVSRNHTVIMIAHRLSTLSQCNKIASLSNGSLVEYENKDFDFNKGSGK